MEFIDERPLNKSIKNLADNMEIIGERFNNRK